MDGNKEKKAKLSMTKDALYTTIAAFSLAALALSAILFARRVVKKDPTTQSFHLIGFGFIWFAAMGYFVIALFKSWSKFLAVPYEERQGMNMFLRFITLCLLIISSIFLLIQASLFVYSLLSA